MQRSFLFLALIPPFVSILEIWLFRPSQFFYICTLWLGVIITTFLILSKLEVYNILNKDFANFTEKSVNIIFYILSVVVFLSLFLYFSLIYGHSLAGQASSFYLALSYIPRTIFTSMCGYIGFFLVFVQFKGVFNKM